MSSTFKALSSHYLEHEGISQSKLKYILDGVDVFKYHKDILLPSTDSQKLGQAVHILTLEPERSNLIVNMPKINGATREGKIFKFLMEGKKIDFFPVKNNSRRQEHGLFYEIDSQEYDFLIRNLEKYGHVFENPDKYLLLSLEEYVTARSMTSNIQLNSDAYNIIKACAHYEKPIFFEHKNIKFKSQLDGFGHRFILDLKTTNIKNDDYLIEKEIINRKYHFQAACYRQALLAHIHQEDPLVGCEITDLDYYIIFVKNEPPYTVFPVQLSRELLWKGEERFDEACDIYNTCLAVNRDFIANNKLRII